MKVGDLVKHCFSERVGVILKEVHDPFCATFTINKVFNVAWIDGTTGHNVWNYDLELVK